MRCSFSVAVTALSLISNVFAMHLPRSLNATAEGLIKPKMVIISMFPPEGEAWYGIPEFDVLAMNVTVGGLSPLYPDVHCTANADVCQVTIGESGMWTRVADCICCLMG